MPLAFNSDTIKNPYKFVPPKRYVPTFTLQSGATLPAVNNTKKRQPAKAADKPNISSKQLAQMLYNQISGPSLNKNTIALLKMVTKDNVAEVIIEYQKLSQNNSLMKDINEELGLDINTVKEYLGKKLLEQAKILDIDLVGMRDIDKINDTEEINEILDILAKKIKTCQETIKRAENLRKNNSLEALKKQYPSDKYQIIERTTPTAKLYDIRLKKDNSQVKFVLWQDDYININYFKNNQHIKSESIIEKTKTPHVIYTMHSESVTKYDKNGKHSVTYNYSENDGVKTSKYTITNDNLDEIVHEDLHENLSFYDTKKYTVFDNQVKNDNYTGDKFDIKFDGYKAIIVNKTKNQKYELDVAKLLNNKYIKEEDKKKFLRVIKTLPGEVLADLAIECNLIGNRQNMSEEFSQKELKATSEFMSTGFNSSGIAYSFYSAMLAKPDKAVITHELGHLMQWVDRYRDVSDGSWEDRYRKTFEEELPNYLESLSASAWPFRQYCSENHREFFAETYTYLMLGHTGDTNDDVIKKFFPKSFKMVKERIAEVRKMRPQKRNADIESCTFKAKEEPKGIFERIKSSVDAYFTRLTGIPGNYTGNIYSDKLKENVYKERVYDEIDNTY